MRRPSTLRRRLFLGGLGAAGVGAVPLLRSLESTSKAATGFPKRLVIWFTPNGSVPEEWFPKSGGETDFVLGRILKPLEDAGFRDKLLVMGGLDMKSTQSGPGDGHQVGMGHMLTGTALLDGDVKGGCDTCPAAGLAGGISVDQRVANQIGNETPFRSLELGIRADRNSENAWTRMSYRGSNQALPPEVDPNQAFARVFGDVDVDPAERAKQEAMRKSVIDSVKQDFGSFESRLSSDDKKRLESHYEGVLSIEKRLGLVGAGCEKPVLGAPLQNPRSQDNIREVADRQIEVATMAMACDLTRVVSFQWSNSVGDNLLSFLNANGTPIADGHHAISHLDDQTAAREQLIVINQWYATKLAELLTAMDRVVEGDGAILSNSPVIWVNELAEGGPHNHSNMPFLIAGNAGGAFRTGRYVTLNKQPYNNKYDWKGVPHNNLWVSVCQAYGIDTNTFGDPNFCTGAIPELT
ncbi:MAG: DUF1552 domain-containing protein [Myxococcales bacterium]|nr:DUF1552 domain-containing protein [Myxococcales bacterium]